MKRLVILAAVGMILSSVPSALAGGWGIGGFGGITIPVEQADAENGIVYGLRARLPAFWALTLEPQVFLLQNGDYDVEWGSGEGQIETGLKSWKATSFGANLILGAPVRQFSGVRPFIFGGVRLNSMDFDGRDSETQLGFGAGLGLEIGSGMLGFEVRATGEVFPDGDGSSRKNGIITGGLNIYLGR
jgi:hypothetical protein